MYTVMLQLAMNGSAPSGMRIVRKFPLTNWDQVWKNLHVCPATDEIKSTWYKTMHDLLPTNDRLAAIHLTDTTACSSCGHPDSLQHRIRECGEGLIIWIWTKKNLGYMLRVDLRYIPPEWTMRPAFRHWPAQKVSGTLGFCASRSLPLTGPTSPFSFGLYGLFAPDQMEAIPPSPQACGYRQVFGCHRLAVAVM
jgi:hypothetical protein